MFYYLLPVSSCPKVSFFRSFNVLIVIMVHSNVCQPKCEMPRFQLTDVPLFPEKSVSYSSAETSVPSAPTVSSSSSPSVKSSPLIVPSPAKRRRFPKRPVCTDYPLLIILSATWVFLLLFVALLLLLIVGGVIWGAALP